MKPLTPVKPMIPAQEPDNADTNVLQYSTAEKLCLIACSENATTELIFEGYNGPLVCPELLIWQIFEPLSPQL